jgi:tellurite resistance protein
MALFSKLRGTAASAPPVNSAETAARGILSISFLAAAADGKIEEAEVLQIMSMCAYSPIFHAIGHKRTHEISAEVLKDLRSQGANALFESAKAVLSQPLRETALCFAIRASLADGYLDPSEKNTLAAMGDRLGVSADDFVQMFNVLAKLQRPATA